MEGGVASGEISCFVLFKDGRLFRHVFKDSGEQGRNAGVMSLSRWAVTRCSRMGGRVDFMDCGRASVRREMHKQTVGVGWIFSSDCICFYQ